MYIIYAIFTIYIIFKRYNGWFQADKHKTKNSIIFDNMILYPCIIQQTSYYYTYLPTNKGTYISLYTKDCVYQYTVEYKKFIQMIY